ncbi:MAG: IclR family transcriptional regulator, regulon repressor [Actinomycetota bacterium]|nr:IclR family transcriptional regulator, regulon repressor [Actinomycetota bacterium]
MPSADPPTGRPAAAPHAKTGLSSVSSAARLLKEFRHGERDLGVTELSRRLGLGKSTVHRILTTLTAEGLLEREPTSGLYRLGLAMYDLGSNVPIHRDIHQLALPVMEALRQQTQESLHVAVRDGREVVYVERLESQQTVRTFMRIGHRNWAHCTSTGKVLLAFLPGDQLESLLDGWDLVRKTDRTISGLDELRAELVRVRSRGYGTNVNESEPGVASVAAPIRDSRGEVLAALSLVGPTMRLSQRSLRQFATLVVDGAQTVSQRLGHRRTSSDCGA